MNYKEIIESVKTLSERTDDRRHFHLEARKDMEVMASPEFIHRVFEMNLSDNVYLDRKWTTYEIPFLYIFENKHYYLKYHVFPPVASGETWKTANIIHHHNNYLLTSLTVQGPGYHTMQFDPHVKEISPGSVKLRLTKDFFHGLGEFSFVDSFEPHLVFNMSDLTTTLVLWSSDKKRLVDGLRNHPVIKPFKKPLLKAIHGLKLTGLMGVAGSQVYQWYIDRDQVKSILEEDYFASYKAISGPETDAFYTQAVCLFLQRSGYDNSSFLGRFIDDYATPAHWRKWLVMMKEHEPIPQVYGKETINIPGGRMLMDDVRRVCT